MNGVKSHIKFVIGYKNTDELIQNLKNTWGTVFKIRRSVRPARTEF